MRVVERRPVAVIAAVTVGVLVAAWSCASAGARGDHSPRVIELQYGEAPGDQGPDRALDAFARATNALRFSTAYHGHHAAAPGRYRTDVTNTRLHGRAKHPWEPNRKRGGRRVISLVHKALFNRGWVRVKLRARGHGVVESVRVRIDRSSDCTSDPPLYPISCQVRVH